MVREEIMHDMELRAIEKLKKLDKVYMNIATEISGLSHCKRSQVGAIIVKDGNIISMGYNGTPKGFDNCCEDTVFALNGEISLVTKKEVLHAEMNAVLKAARTGNPVEGSTLYITLAPCIDCSKYLLQSGIKRVVYLEDYRDNSGVELLKHYIKVEKHGIE
jgi:dCMP deaminase